MKYLVATLAIFCFAENASAQSRTVLLSSPTSGYTYFNRPGATLSVHNQELTDCVDQAGHTRSLEEMTYPPNGQPNGILIDAMISAGRRATFMAGIENCMIVKGWNVMQIPSNQGTHFAHVSYEEFSSTLSSWIGSATPTGSVVRHWSNDALRASTRSTSRPPFYNGVSMSLSLIANPGVKQADAFDFPQPQLVGERLRREQIDSASPNEAVLLFRLNRSGAQGGSNFFLERVGSDGSSISSNPGAEVDRLNVQIPFVAIPHNGLWLAYSVPPGRWRMSDIGISLGILNFCLGSPSFEVAAGEVVYAGTFDLSSENITPDLSLSDARSWLGAATAATHVRSANYTNGWTSSCSGNVIYALEFDGLPFKQGYVWGGAVAPHQ